MAFFDEMKSKVSQVSQSAAKSAKDFSETTRLNSEISGTEERITQLYTRIGYEIYCAHNADPLPEVATLIEQINTLHDHIDNCRLQIEQINAASRCPNCGMKIKPGMAFCSGCGTPLAQPEPAPQPVAQKCCPSCGAPVDPEAMFCTSCGSRLDAAPVQQPEPDPVEMPIPGDSSAVAHAPEEEPAPSFLPDPVVEEAVPAESIPELQPESADSLPEVCPSCGTILPHGMVFCTNCGTRVQPAAEAEPFAEEPPVFVPHAAVCPGCGAPVAEDAIFCTNCGTRLG